MLCNFGKECGTKLFRLSYNYFEIDLNKGDISLSFFGFTSAQLAPVLGNTDLRYHLSRLNQSPQHISCRVITCFGNFFLLQTVINSRHMMKIQTFYQRRTVAESKRFLLYVKGNYMLSWQFNCSTCPIWRKIKFRNDIRRI